MPKHLAVGRNAIGGTASFNNTKTAACYYRDLGGNQILFTIAPQLQITLRDSTTNPPFKTGNIKSGNLFAGFVIGFQSNFTGEVEWQAIERG